MGVVWESDYQTISFVFFRPLVLTSRKTWKVFVSFPGHSQKWMLEWPRNETIRVWYYLADGQMLGRQLAIQLSVIWLDTLLSLRRTPLHWATVCENPEVIRALLANGGTYTHS